MPKKSNNKDNEQPKNRKENFFQKVSLFVFAKHRAAIVVAIFLVLLGALSYTTLLRREGFPPIETPISLASGTYFVDDSEKVDQDVLVPVQEVLSENEKVTSIQTNASENVFSIFAGFEESVSAEEAANIVSEAFETAEVPEQVEVSVPKIDVGKFMNEYTMLLSVYVEGENIELENLEQTAIRVASEFESVESTVGAVVIDPFSEGVNPNTGQKTKVQTGFSRYGEYEGSNGLDIYPSILIGLKADEDVDAIEYSTNVNDKIDELTSSEDFNGVQVAVSADNAPSILTQIASLENNLLTGLLAVSFITFLLITWRASIITALFMVSVVSVTLLVLFLIGYSLNTITLFSLVLALGLFVDDATIIVEAIDAGKAKKLKPIAVIREAVGRVGAASFAGTFTTVLVFLPMAFISGILGSFIRIMPVTIIVALITSLILSLTLIPVLAKYLLLSNEKKSYSPLGGLESAISRKLASLPLVFRKSRAKGYGITFLMIGVSVLFFVAAMGYAGLVKFNIFPSSKDSDLLSLNISYEQGTTIAEAEDIADRVNQVILDETEPGIIENISYSVISQTGGLSNERSANALIMLEPFTERDIKSPEIIDNLLSATEDIEGAKVVFGQLDAGPPAAEFPFKVQIYTDDVSSARTLAMDMEEFLLGSEVERLNGTTATINSVDMFNFDQVVRSDGDRVFEVGAGFDADDVTALVEAAQVKVEDEFNDERLAQYGLSSENIEFDFGQESENQESFQSMMLVGLGSIVAMYVLLATQFRSFVKPFLIFMAIPFSLLGVFAGLYYTDNPLSFFVMVGLFGLIGIAVNNTILLTDYANQERADGQPIVEAISHATQKRFRPLVTTSITTVVALLPLALSDPFWEALAFTIIFGLLSSTILVVVSFPYYYMLIEGARTRVRAKFKKA